MTFPDALAAANAAINATVALLLVAGYRAIRRKQRDRHRRIMLAALGLSALFLLSYLLRLSLSGTHAYPREAPLRGLYLGVLLVHTVLAAFVPFLALRSAWLAGRERLAAHRRLARWTLPVWLVVAVTGVMVYVLLYHVGLPAEATP